MRLIDADKLVEQIKEDYCENCNSYHGVKCRGCWVDDVIGLVEDAPEVKYETD